MSLENMLRQLVEGQDNRLVEPATPEFTLQELLDKVDAPADFGRGDDIVWKCEQLRNMKLLEDGGTARAVRFVEPLYDTNQSFGSALRAAPLDLLIAVRLDDGDYAEFLVDSRRFKKA